MRRQREYPSLQGSLTLVFGARKPEDSPCFGRLKKVPDSFMKKFFTFSRMPGEPKRYVQDELLGSEDGAARILQNPKSNIDVCGHKAREQGVDRAQADIAREIGLNRPSLRDSLRESGRYHVETY